MEVKVSDWHTDIIPTDEEVKRLCKPGAGADTCIWLVMSPKGWECVLNHKPHALVDRFLKGETTAKRDGCKEAEEATDKALVEAN